MSEYFARLDGCATGWVVVYRDPATHVLGTRLIRRIEELFDGDAGPAAAGIDVPIGLPDRYTRGGRACDREARKLLGPKRGPSVFPCPARAVLAATSREEASRLNRDADGEPVGVTLQCFHILAKIREVDRAMTPELQRRMIEVHPELCFYELNGGRPVLERKKSRAGRKLRIALLERAWEQPLADTVERARRAGCARDDVVDAMAACWTAERVARGAAVRVPAHPDVDSRGLRMEIVR